MSGFLRITGGYLVRRRFLVPKEADAGTLRPAQDRVREALFSALADRLKDAQVLDLFSGSGAFSFEALSRGAQSSLLLEASSSVARNIQENAQSLGLEKKVEVRLGDALRFVEQGR